MQSFLTTPVKCTGQVISANRRAGSRASPGAGGARAPPSNCACAAGPVPRTRRPAHACALRWLRTSRPRYSLTTPHICTGSFSLFRITVWEVWLVGQDFLTRRWREWSNWKVKMCIECASSLICEWALLTSLMFHPWAFQLMHLPGPELLQERTTISVILSSFSYPTKIK